VATSTDELWAVVERVRKEAREAGELRPPRIGPIPKLDLPDDVRQAIWEDLRSGAYRRHADEAVDNDPDLIL
jgi:hypothetical protein